MWANPRRLYMEASFADTRTPISMLAAYLSHGFVSCYRHFLHKACRRVIASAEDQ